MKNHKSNINTKKLFFRKNGFFIEFPKIDKWFITYLIRKGLQFFFDVGVFVALMMVLWLVFNFSFWQSSLLTIFFNWLYLGFNLFLFKGRSLGMLLTQLQVTNYDGDVLNKGKLILRILLSGLYSVTVVGLVIAFISIISSFFNRGLTPIDIISKTQILNQATSRELLDIYRHLESEEQND